MVCFFLSLLKRKLPERCPKQGGGRGVKATFGQCPKGSSFFFRITSLRIKKIRCLFEIICLYFKIKFNCLYLVVYYMLVPQASLTVPFPTLCLFFIL